ncbi:hypothetical protein EDC04DRAFT_2601082 [Pisolithus marmoratus]|nr:hypothetical protein EDC04DRAFT_2601082 [Pisolithus marmoratus]
MAAENYWTWKYLICCINDKEIWMSQEYVDTLATIGEWRAFIIGGKILLVIHMQKKSDGTWIGTPIELFMTGMEIQEVMKRELHPANAAEWRKHLINPQHSNMLVHNEDTPHYFVNEVEQSTATSLKHRAIDAQDHPGPETAAHSQVCQQRRDFPQKELGGTFDERDEMWVVGEYKSRGGRGLPQADEVKMETVS